LVALPQGLRLTNINKKIQADEEKQNETEADA